MTTLTATTYTDELVVRHPLWAACNRRAFQETIASTQPYTHTHQKEGALIQPEGPRVRVPFGPGDFFSLYE